jgi:hypothetical protein
MIVMPPGHKSSGGIDSESFTAFCLLQDSDKSETIHDVMGVLECR